MEITGEHWLPAPPEVVWEYLHDTDVLKETVPGCKELTQTSPSSFEGAASVGIGIIKGLYKGKLDLVEEHPVSGAKVAVQARSGHAEINGSGAVELEPQNDGTLLRYRGEARISGPIAAVGQRLLPSASKSLTEQFFKNLEAKLRARSN
jgi:carbon monoxide dehydrogenase subunit G